MHIGKNYSLMEVLVWTRRDIFLVLVLAAIPTTLYELCDYKWLAIPWIPIALIGTAVAFMIGFKNNAAYDRVWEARKAWGGIVNSSRAWGMMVRDYVTTTHAKSPITSEELKKIHSQLINRHFAWLTAMRFQLREERQWESASKPHNKEYRETYYSVDEQNLKIESELARYLSPEELSLVLSKKNRAAQLIALQSAHLRELLAQGLIEDFRHMELEKILIEFLNQQGVSERIKNFPYPRQFATVNLILVKLFIVFVPLGMLQEFEKLGDHFVWLSIPFSGLVSWVFTSMEKIGEATENPFEGSANDVPITTMSRAIEIDLREMFNETEIPAGIAARNNILT